MNTLEFTTEEKEIVLLMLSEKAWEIINNALDANEDLSSKHPMHSKLNAYSVIVEKLNGVYC